MAKTLLARDELVPIRTHDAAVFERSAVEHPEAVA